MGILGIGIDVVHLPRMVAVIRRRTPARLASRILSPTELSHFGELPPGDSVRLLRFLAVRWSVKEAAYKALYPTFRPSWKDLTYRSLEGLRKPSLEYRPLSRDDDAKVIRNMHVSVSHDGEYVFTTVLAEST
ncbi:hypothetical protein JAAARDRAFT_117055 [Jaapia argillacea MUCL 33604]|uniref:4'-phosphopantetheinyl transferase domain-containing protein n=1 Tax=Jaapia argillacea MUCL 33604 TaxID=933084 RepID=A0A067QCP1_9AGAM|nr:hypothetical protein JAAARDRAFT_117055 [Jaapia argillacea MUCL 33604]